MTFLLPAIIHLLVLFKAVIGACFALCGALSTIGQELINASNNIIHNGIQFHDILPNRATVAKTLFGRIPTFLIQWLIRPMIYMALRATLDQIIYPVLSMALWVIRQRIARPIHRVFIQPLVKVTLKLLKIAESILLTPAKVFLTATSHIIAILKAGMYIFAVFKAIFQTCSVFFGALSKLSINKSDILPERGNVARTLLRQIPTTSIQCLFRLVAWMVVRVTLRRLIRHVAFKALRWLMRHVAFMVLCAIFQRIIQPVLLFMALAKICQWAMCLMNQIVRGAYSNNDDNKNLVIAPIPALNNDSDASMDELAALFGKLSISESPKSVATPEEVSDRAAHIKEENKLQVVPTNQQKIQQLEKNMQRLFLHKIPHRKPLRLLLLPLRALRKSNKI